MDVVLIIKGSGSLAAATREHLYVSISRGREAVRIYTDDRQSLFDVAERANERLTARNFCRLVRRRRRTCGTQSECNGCGYLNERGGHNRLLARHPGSSMRDRGGRDHDDPSRVLQNRESENEPTMDSLNAGTAILLDCMIRKRGRLTLPNAYLTLIRWNEESELWLDYPELRVQVTGSQLGPLYVGLAAHRVFRIREAASGLSPLAVNIAQITTQTKRCKRWGHQRWLPPLPLEPTAWAPWASV